MAEVKVRIGDKDFRLACDDGQEKRVTALAKDFDQRVVDALSQDKKLGESHALVIAALAVLDEFEDAKKRWADITPEGTAAEWAADRLDQASARLEKALNS